ncbi:2OG-Fe(II) oxygenase [Novosphingobium sp. 9]|uniref:2OG-Fe(II) oxygenase n=1 Tax=Novosphingobium sp. 9 TaxID=2025349 RepID=UPI0021B608B7|nr:2OG-Fe(II) oxygenase [Novosphingobium sp. 9]
MVARVDLTNLGRHDVEALAQAYKSAQPFPNMYIDNFFETEILDQILDEFVTHPGEMEASTYNTLLKRRQSNLNVMGPVTRALIEDMHSPAFIRFLEKVTGIKGLIPDPFLFGGGTHEIGTGGFLKLHTDFNWHKRLNLHRRVNLLLYLNKDWQPEWNGALELWDAKVQTKGAEISPIFNRLALFSTTDESYHGHPEPLACPEGQSRKSIALYYYTAERPKNDTQFGKSTQTNWRAKPGEQFDVNPVRYAVAQTLLRFPIGRKVARMLGKNL